MAEQIEWEPLALSLLNLLDKCEIDFEEVTYPIAANVFNCLEMALPVILVEGVDSPNTTQARNSVIRDQEP